MVNFYHKFIPKLSEILAPITSHLLKFAPRKRRAKDNDLLDPKNFFWPPDSEQAFTDVKAALLFVTMLICPIEGAPINLVTDASETAIGGVLQQFHDNAWRPLGSFPRS